MENRILIDRFAVKNYRSIKECDVQLGPLTFLVGANGSGKTSFVDALLFVANALNETLQRAILTRGGIHGILYQFVSRPACMSFSYHMSSEQGFRCEFQLELQVSSDWSVTVAREECQIDNSDGVRHSYLVSEGKVTGTAAVFPAFSPDRIFLANASGLPEFRSIFDFLRGVVGSEPLLPHIHSLIQHTGRTGHNLATRYLALGEKRPDRLDIIEQYMRAIAPTFKGIDVVESDNKLWLRFVESSPSGEETPFYIEQSSAGLVNCADMLLELFEPPALGCQASPVIIEEPEAFLHPGAIQVMLDSFRESSNIRQVLVTTHSPELLDDREIPPDRILAVQRDQMGSHVTPLESATKSIIQDRLYTPGQLLRQGGLY
jgi:predicted ATPase